MWSSGGGGEVFQHIVCNPMGTNCAPLLAEVFLCSNEAEFIQSLLSTRKKHLASQSGFTCGCIGGVLSVNDPYFENCLARLCPAGLGIGDATESDGYASCFALLL